MHYSHIKILTIARQKDSVLRVHQKCRCRVPIAPGRVFGTKVSNYNATAVNDTPLTGGSRRRKQVLSPKRR